LPKEECSVKKPVIVPIEKLSEEPYSSVLCYPKPNEDELHSRMQELRNQGVLAVEFSGKASAYGVKVPVLGKGYVGIVIIALVRTQRLALKIRRMDADRADLFHEATMLAKANSVNVGPKLFGVSKNFLLMQLIDGDLFSSWLSMNKEKALMRRVLLEVLENCYKLDEIGLDHGELSKAPKHVIIDLELKPFVVDFETASDKRKPANLSAMCHFLFIGGGEVARTVAKTLGQINKEEIVKCIQKYKKRRTRESFELVLKACLS
jgi:putative serine/threonine protein kinase